MARKFIKDGIFASRAGLIAALSEAHENSAALTGMDLNDVWSITQDNLPTITTDDGEISALNPTDTGAPDLAADVSLGTLALVTIWGDGEQEQPTGEPVAIPAAFYILTLPKREEVATDKRLAEKLGELLDRDALSKARKLAKMHHADAEKSPLSRDRFAAFLSAASGRGGSKADAAYTKIYSVLQKMILSQVAKRMASLKEAKNFADARLLGATFNNQRLNRVTLQECLMSTEAAKFHFPSMPQAQWDSILKIAAAYAPKHMGRKPATDENGVKLRTADDKPIWDEVSDPQSPTIFMSWLETREAESIAPTDAPTVDFGDMLPAGDAQSAQSASTAPA